MDFSKVSEELKKRGYEVSVFDTGREAAEYLNGKIDAETVGIGGSATVEKIGLYELLATHNEVFWHWKQDPGTARRKAMSAQVYVTSANALAETGEIINIDGVGNRVAATLFGHEKVYFVIGRNKLAPTYEEAVWRARNVAAPGRARQLGRKTPCAAGEPKCYDCQSPERLCRGMVVLFGPMSGMKAEVVLIDEELGL